MPASSKVPSVAAPVSTDESVSGFARGRPCKRRLSVKRDFDLCMAGKRLWGKERPMLCIPKLTFRRLVEEIAAGFKSDLRIRGDAIHTLQEDAELLVIERFKRCARLAEICHKDTVQSKHWNFVREDEEGVALPYSGRS